jgi:hypothetical protein
MRSRLKLFTGDNEFPEITQPQVSIPLGEILQAISEAVVNDRTWLSDFREDEVKVSADLYDIISASIHLRPSA